MERNRSLMSPGTTECRIALAEPSLQKVENNEILKVLKVEEEYHFVLRNFIWMHPASPRKYLRVEFQCLKSMAGTGVAGDIFIE